MMRKITLWLLTVFSIMQVNAQLWTINSCSNLGSSTYGPMYSIATANATNRTAVIYPSSQLTGITGQQLTNMYFQRTTATGSMAGTPNFKIYLKEVTATDWGGTALDWATEIATATLVYDSNPATIVGTTNGWKGFPLTGSFTYTGTNNLAVFMEYSNTTASTAITWNYEYTAPCISTTNNNTTKYINNTTGTPGASLTSSNYRRPLIGFDYPVSCPAPTSLIVSNVLNNQVDVSWTDSASGWNLQYGPVGFTLGTGTTISTGSNPHVLSPLSPNTAYDVYVQTDCGGGDLSVWVGPVSFTTLCNSFSAPWTYDVESATPTTNSSIGDCWTSNPTGTTTLFRWDVDGAGSTPTGSTGPSGANSGFNYFYAESSSGTIGSVAELLTPLIDVSGLTDPSFQFYYHMYGATTGELHVDIYDGASWNNDMVIIVGEQQTSDTSPWNQSVVSLSTLTITGNVQARFRAIKGSGITGDISLDDISFDEAPSCFDPISLLASNVGSNSFDLEWADASGGAQFDFYYVVQPAGTGTAGTLVENYYDASGGFPFTVTCTDASDCANTLLTPTTDYEVYVRADCSTTWVGPINFTTTCAVYTVPSFEDFTTYVPACWEEADNGDLISGPATYGSSSWIADGFGNNGTTGSARIEIWQATLNDWIISPAYAIPATGWELKFNAATTQWNTTAPPTTAWESDDVVEVLISTTGTTNWTVLYTYNDSNVPSTTGTYNIINLDAYAGQNVRFAFRAVEGASNGAADVNFYVDDFEIRMTPSCPEPVGITVTNVTSSQADISWTSTGSNWNIEYGPSGFTLGTGTTVAAGTNPFTLTPLSAQTTYDVYVQNDCGGGDLSTWSGPATFTTLCAAVVAPWTYDVESAATTTNSSIADCWSSTPTGTGSLFRWDVDGAGSTPSTGTGPDGAYSGVKYFYTEASSGATGAVAELYTPFVDVSPLTNPTLQFYYHMYGVNMGELHVDVYDGATWNNDMFVVLGQQHASGSAAWTLGVVNLGTLTITGNIQVRFRGIRGAGFESDMSLDDISFAEAPTCFDPINLAATNVTSNSFDLSWVDASSGAQFDFYYVVQPAGTGTGGTLVENYYDASSGFPFTVTCTDATDCANTLLSSATDYEVYVRADCSGTWVGPLNLTTACSVFSVPELEDFVVFLPNCWEEADGGDLIAGPNTFGTGGWVVDGFGNVGTTGAIKNNIYTTGANDWVLSPLYAIPATGWELKFDAAATQFASTNAPTSPWESDDYVEVLVSTGTTNWTVLYTYNNTNVPSNTGTTNIIDLDAYAGQDIRFAFRAVEGATNGPADIDFSIDNFEIRLTPACPEPTGLSVTNITDTSATITWTATTGNYEYVLDNNPADPAGAGTPIAGETYNATPLTPSTTYYFHVRSDCGSTWVTISFTTLATPPVNDNLCNAIPLTIGAATTGSDYTLVGATAQTSEPVPACFNGGINNSVWFSFVAPSTSVEVTTDFAGGTLSDGDTEISVYDATGVTCSDLSTLPANIGCDQDGGTTVNFSSYLTLSSLTPGTTYYVQVDMWGTATAGTFGIQVNDLLSTNNFDTNSFVAYPNPVKNVLNLEYANEISSVRVINMLGQEVLSRIINATSTQVDMSQLAAGTYLVNVTSGDVQKIIKVVKQ